MELTESHVRSLQELVVAGFELVNFPFFPAHVGVKKYGCGALLKPLPEGRLEQSAQAGHLIEGNISVVVERGGEKWFIWKSHQIRATQELLSNLRRFEEELQRLLQTPPTV